MPWDSVPPAKFIKREPGGSTRICPDSTSFDEVLNIGVADDSKSPAQSPAMWGRVLMFASALSLGALASAQAINYTFDSDSQGWTKGDLGSTFTGTNLGAPPAVWDAATQAILGSDHAGYAFHFSPDLGGGYGHLFGQDLTLDYRSVSNGGEDPFLVLMSSTSYLVLEKQILASATLDPYTFKLDSSSPFYFNSSQYYQGGSAVLATDADILGVLSDLRHIGVSTDIAGGGDTTYLDNVQAVPEPGTIALLAAGGAALALRRRKAKA